MGDYLMGFEQRGFQAEKGQMPEHKISIEYIDGS